MATKPHPKARKKSTITPSAKTGKPNAVQEALQVTWLLKGNLKNVQLSYLRVGALLAKVRDNKLYNALQHPDMEDYAEKRLNLGRSSLYKYLQVYEWVRKFHPEWLQPKPKGFIPDLSDIGDLIWIENELQRKDLGANTKAALEALRIKALNGQLRQSELNPWRQTKQRSAAGLKTLLSNVRTLRRRSAQLKNMPSEALTHLDAAIEIIRNALAVPEN